MNSFERESDNVTAGNVPGALVECDRWVCWRYEEVDGKVKKPPYDPVTGEKRNAHDPNTWADFETALSRYREASYDGIGFVLTADDSFTGVDFDDCRDPDTGEIQLKISELIRRLDSFSEVSPSGTGIHTIILGEKPDGYRNIEGIEVYDSARYFTVTGEHLEETPGTIEPRCEELRAICEQHLSENSSNRQKVFNALPEDSEITEEIEEAQEYIRDFLHSPDTGPRPPDYFTDLLKGRYADRGFEGDRSGAETTLCSLTYGIFLDQDIEPNHARELTYHYVTHAARKTPYTASGGDIRKWVEGAPGHQRNYRQRTLDYAIQNFDPKIWGHWRQSGHRTDTNDYCEHAYKVALDALYNLTVEHAILGDPPTLSTNNTPDSCGYRERENPYPTLGLIAERAQEEYELSEDSYREILRRIRRKGGAKMARLGSSTYVYYPASYPDPPEACYVRDEGGKREPDSESSGEAPKRGVTTDGGTPMNKTESLDKLERIRQVRDGETDVVDCPETFICPVEGCGRTVIGNPGDLQNHVRQSGDDAHRHKRLNGDLKIETAWSEMDWGFGTAAFDSPPTIHERQSVYEPDDVWGPGAPESEG